MGCSSGSTRCVIAKNYVLGQPGGGWRGRYANMGAMHEVTPIVAPKAVKILMMVWIMNFQVSFFVIVVE